MRRKKQAKKTGKPGRPASTRYVHFRFPQPLIEKLDRFARVESDRTGYHVTRSAALRKLLELGLEAAARKLEVVDDLFGETTEAKPKPKASKKPTGPKPRGGAENCPHCGKPTASRLLGDLRDGSEKEVCAECGEPRT